MCSCVSGRAYPVAFIRPTSVLLSGIGLFSSVATSVSLLRPEKMLTVRQPQKRPVLMIDTTREDKPRHSLSDVIHKAEALGMFLIGVV